jgi:hypothetical protein
MLKKLSLLFILFSTKFVFAESNHLEKIKSRSPYALIGNDFGILNKDDLAINACEAIPSPFEFKITSYPHWQCFEAKTARLFCDGHGYDESEKTYLTLLVIAAEKNHERHEYITRRAIHYEDCISYALDWHRLLKGEKYVCVSGPFISKKDKGYKGKNLYSWIFNSFKTKKGCIPYFKGWCDLNFLQKQHHNCDPNRK